MDRKARVTKEEVSVYIEDIIRLLGLSNYIDSLSIGPELLKERYFREIKEALEELDIVVAKVRDMVGSGQLPEEEVAELADSLRKAIREFEDGVLSKRPYGQSLLTSLLSEPKRLREVLGFLSLRGGLPSKIEDLLGAINKIKKTIDEALSQPVPRGDLGEILKGRETDKTIYMAKKYTERLSKIDGALRRSRDGLEKIYRDFRRLAEMENRYVAQLSSLKDIKNKIQVAQQLSARVSRLWAEGVLDILTGLSSVTATPSFEQIEFRLEGEEHSYLNIDELFFRYPPYEPISIKKEQRLFFGRRQCNIMLAGNFVWFIDAKDAVYDNVGNLCDKKWTVCKGSFEHRLGGHVLKEVKPIKIIDGASRGEIKIRVRSKDGFKVFIKYGSRRLMETIQECMQSDIDDVEECVRQRYLSALSRGGRRATRKTSSYNPLNLTYVWYCRLGKGLTTDPWDFRDCPFKDKCDVCLSGGCSRGKRCIHWSFSRRIFPKIFPVIERQVYSKRLEEEHDLGVFRIFSAKHSYILENYTGVQWTMPTYGTIGRPMVVEFSDPFTKVLPDTNLIGLSIPLELVLRLGEDILDKKIDLPTIELGRGRSTTIREILTSKYFLWHITERGLKTFSILRKSQDRILKDYRQFLTNLQKSDDLRKGFKEFVAKVLAHSLAHLLLSYISSQLNLEPKDLIYYYHLDINKKSLEVIVAENSPLGNIDMPRQIQEYFGDTQGMVKSFIEDTAIMLSKHDQSIKGSLTSLDNLKNSFLRTNPHLKDFIYALEDYYNKFLKEEFILDQWYLSLHLILSGKYEKLAKDKNIDPEEAYRHFDHIIPLIGPPICTDGCTSCLVFEKLCTDTLGQTITLSRHLVNFFLGLFHKGMVVSAVGGRVGPWLVENLPKKKLVAVTPFINPAGVDLLNRLTKRGVKVVLVTKKQTKDRIAGRAEFEIIVQSEPSHEKLYIIDDRMVIVTSWNLLPGAKSRESFQILLDREKALEREKFYLGSKK